jgi:DNA-directed RNA polymerase subunit RPC12/RpoP
VSNSMYFVQECPTCGRRLNIRVEYLGKAVVCQHCSGRFVAYDEANGPSPSSASGSSLLKRAEELLDSAARCAEQARTQHPR